MISSKTDALSAYAETMRRYNATSAAATGDGSSTQGMPATSGGADFGSVLGQAIESAVQQGHTAETQATQGLSGTGDMTAIVTSVANAQMTLQMTTVLRDRFVQAYQNVMSMSI